LGRVLGEPLLGRRVPGRAGRQGPGGEQVGRPPLLGLDGHHPGQFDLQGGAAERAQGLVPPHLLPGAGAPQLDQVGRFRQHHPLHGVRVHPDEPGLVHPAHRQGQEEERQDEPPEHRQRDVHPCRFHVR
jgi:hypothetical protein